MDYGYPSPYGRGYRGPYGTLRPVTVDPLLDQLLAYYRFDNTLTDESGNSRTLVGSVLFSTSAFFKKLGTHAAAIGLSNPQSVLTFGGSATLNDTDITLCGWVSRNNTGVTDKGAFGWTDVIGVGGFNDGLYGHFGGSDFYFGAADLPNRTPVFAAIIWDRGLGSVKFWANGSNLGSSITPPVNTALSGEFGLKILAGVTSNAFGFDSMAAYARAFSHAELLELYNAGTGLDPTV